MFWNRPAQKQPEPEPESRHQILYYAQTPLKGDLFAVIRVTWHEKGKLVGVVEDQLEGSLTESVISEFGGIVGEALRGGADVSIICSEPPEAVGIEGASNSGRLPL